MRQMTTKLTKKLSNLNLKTSGQISRILVTGSNGQLGQGLQPYLDKLYGEHNVFYSDLQPNSKRQVEHYYQLDCLDNN